MKVRFFSTARDAAGCAETDLCLSRPVSEHEFWMELTSEFPAIGAMRAHVRLARNHRYTNGSEIFDIDDEIAVIPPVSGG